MIKLPIFILLISLMACTTPQSNKPLIFEGTIDTKHSSIDHKIHAMIDQELAQQKYWESIESLDDSSFVDLEQLDSMFILDIRYATTNNFTKKVLYDCPKALLRKIVALQLVKVQQELVKQGYRIKIFDAYRPLTTQWRMWKAYPDRRYVADPNKGSWHNRGLAIDLTLCTLEGKQLDMGTHYDYFGKEAWPSYQKLPKEVLENRKLLAKTMFKYGFGPTSTEWWHYSYRGVHFEVSDFPFECQKN
ncbi:M15 family metallopeptidase [Flammeovirga sp. MY04]|uniref:M15 family metallopeptidase n=1 Tax=Flammeovirga sp. MY04 TaxID=1191459 RepID=UPI0008061DEE|nr:M15 family metallopeptidase [Flammeovirga sp. MY04]ANQ47933.1 M15 family metallopeptidase [Flammeovirga sp. MY04]